MDIMESTNANARYALIYLSLEHPSLLYARGKERYHSFSLIGNSFQLTKECNGSGGHAPMTTTCMWNGMLGIA